MGDFKFEDNQIEVKAKMNNIIAATLEEAAGEVESQTKRNTRVKTGKTKNSWRHKVVENTAYIGSDYDNTIWDEFGTGDYALEGNGRKGGWFYEDEKGNGHYTHGKRPSRAFWKAYVSMKQKIIQLFEERFKGLG